MRIPFGCTPGRVGGCLAACLPWLSLFKTWKYQGRAISPTRRVCLFIPIVQCDVKREHVSEFLPGQMCQRAISLLKEDQLKIIILFSFFAHADYHYFHPFWTFSRRFNVRNDRPVSLKGEEHRLIKILTLATSWINEELLCFGKNNKIRQ